MQYVTSLSAAALIIAGALSAQAAERQLPDPTTPAYCQAVQEIMANTRQQADVTVFDNMDEYRASKPEPDPLKIFQVVTYDDKRPVMVSCKVKAADHLRAVYGDNAAGEQEICASVTRITQAQAVHELAQEYPEAAAQRARDFIIDENEPYLAGQSYLGEFELSYTDADGRVHIQSPGLQTDWDNWLIWLFPNRVRGQSYCHLATVPYMKALATGAIEPGTVMITTDDARTTPPN